MSNKGNIDVRGMKRKGPKRMKRILNVSITIDSRLPSDIQLIKDLLEPLKPKDEFVIGASAKTILDYLVPIHD